MSKLFEEIKEITLDTIKREVLIEIQMNASKCLHPTFVVRLSGTALYKMKFTGVKKFSNGNIAHSFNYPNLMDTGVYFIEALVVYCQKIDFDHLEGLCVVNPKNRFNVLTEPIPLMLESINTANDGRDNIQGRWILSKNHSAQVLPIRYQKKTCINKWCESQPKELWQHMLYEFVDQPAWYDQFKQLAGILQIPMTFEEPTPGYIKYSKFNVCLIGDSHSDMLATSLQFLIERFHSHGKFCPIAVRYVGFAYPENFTTHLLESMECSVVVMSAGQWPMSFQTRPLPYSMHKLEAELYSMVQRATPPVYKKNARLFLRSENYVGYGRFTECPTTDYRTPPVIDEINIVVKSIADHCNVSFIEMNDIMGPMWDSALDYNHPRGKVANIEAHRLLHSIVNSLLAGNSSNVPVFRGGLNVSRVLRFSPSNEVFLYETGLLRKALDSSEALTVGYVGHVYTISDEHRWLFKFTPHSPTGKYLPVEEAY
jgi:hypothetical protein